MTLKLHRRRVGRKGRHVVWTFSLRSSVPLWAVSPSVPSPSKGLLGLMSWTDNPGSSWGKRSDRSRLGWVSGRSYFSEEVTFTGKPKRNAVKRRGQTKFPIDVFRYESLYTITRVLYIYTLNILLLVCFLTSPAPRYTFVSKTCDNFHLIIIYKLQ